MVATAARNRALIEAVVSGRSATDVGHEYGLSRQRVWQIYTRATGRPVRRGRYCRVCEQKVHWLGHITTAAHIESLAARTRVRRERNFWAKVDRSNPYGCWPWTASTFPTGYGHVHALGNGYAHRAAYELTRGPIPHGLTIDHLCRNRLCVNPAHLDAVTQRENIMRSPIAPAAINARKTHCKRGHPLAAPNGAARRCVTCHRDTSRRRMREIRRLKKAA